MLIVEWLSVAVHATLRGGLSGTSLVLVTSWLGLTSLLTLILSWLSQKGRLHPNHAFGIRTPHTVRDSNSWYRVHKKAAPWFAMAGTSLILGTGLTLLFSHKPTIQLASILTSCGAYVVLLCYGARRAQRKP